MKKAILLALTTGAVLHATSASAQEKNFGSQGVVEFGVGIANGSLFFPPYVGTTSTLTVDHTSESTVSSTGVQSGGGSTTSFTLAPQVHYFVIDGLSLGGTAIFGYTKPDQGDAETTYGIGPTIGYNAWLSPGLVSLWPQVTFLYTASTSSQGSINGQSLSETTSRATIGVFVPFEIHPVKHFNIGIGPTFAYDLSASISSGGQSADTDKLTSFGAAGFIGGWL